MMIDVPFVAAARTAQRGVRTRPLFRDAVTTQAANADAAACTLLPGAFGFVLQGLLAITSLSAVYLKYHCIEKRERPVDVFLCDISKQACGALFVHTLNLIGATVFVHYLVQLHTDACDWYFLNIMLDTTVGMGINYCLLQLSQWILHYTAGRYIVGGSDAETQQPLLSTTAPSQPVGSPGLWIRQRLWDSAEAFAFQTGVWICIVCTMKATIILTLWLTQRDLAPAVHWIFASIQDRPKLKLGIVMIFVPVTMNAMHYLVTDQFLKYRGPKRREEPVGHPFDGDQEQRHRRSAEGDEVSGGTYPLKPVAFSSEEDNVVAVSHTSGTLSSKTTTKGTAPSSVESTQRTPRGPNRDR